MNEKHFLGLGLRIAYAIFMMCGAIACFITGVLFTVLNGDDSDALALGLSLLAACAVFTIITVLSFIGAFKGRTKKWGNNICIAFGAIFCIVLLGIFGVVGGVRGNKAIDHPELEMNAKRSTGFGLRLFFGILMFLSGVAVLIAPIPIPALKIALAVVFLIAGTLGIICAALGRTKKWANTLSIVIGSIFIIAYLTGLFALFGGILGRAPFKRAEAEQKAKRLAQQPELIPDNTPRAPVTEEINGADGYIQPKMGIKGRKAIMIVTIVSYSHLFIMGILLAAVPSAGAIFSGLGICEEPVAQAYSVTIGVMWCALVPAIGYYFSTAAPCNLSKKGKIVLASVTTALLIVMNVVFFIIINSVKIEVTVKEVTELIKVKDCFEGSDSWFIPVSMVFATLGLAVCHALTLFRLNPQKINNQKPEKCGEGFTEVMKHVFALLVYGVLGLVKFILSCKEKQPDIFIFVCTVLLTWLAHFVSFVFAIICIAVLVTVIILCFSGLVSFAYIPNRVDKLVIMNDKGKTQTVYTSNDLDFNNEFGNFKFRGKIEGDKIITEKPEEED